MPTTQGNVALSIDGPSVEIIEDILREWDKAEGDIKIAEQITDTIVMPSINELRYGGRRVVDALTALLSGRQERQSEFVAKLEDARFCCHRARHDAIDAASSKIAVDLKIMIEKIGYSAILVAYPSFATLVRKSSDVQERISQSRKNRDNREAIYKSIEENEFDTFVTDYRNFKASEDMMLAVAAEKKRDHFYGKYGFWVGLVVGLAGIAMALFK